MRRLTAEARALDCKGGRKKMRVLGAVLWLIALLLAVSQGLLMRRKARSEQATEHTLEVQALLLAVSVTVIPASSLSPLHLLWMVPTSFLLGPASVIFPLRILWIPASLYGALWYVGIRNPALARYRAGEYTKAIDAFQEAIRRKPDSAEDRFYLALAYEKVGDHERAMRSFHECIRLQPDFAEAHYNLGFTFKNAGDLQSAMEAFSQAVRLRPSYTKAIASLGMIQVELGDLESAKRQCTILESLGGVQASELRAAIAAAERPPAQLAHAADERQGEVSGA
jgi:tetratricopeptide (TPR) repeat protein